MTNPIYRAGRNIAMKVPARLYDATVAFYRDTLGLAVLETAPSSTMFAFGPMRLWIDRVEHQVHADVWLEVVASDTAAAVVHLAAAGATRCDEVEPLPDGFDGFWIAIPSGAIHLVSSAD